MRTKKKDESKKELLKNEENCEFKEENPSQKRNKNMIKKKK